VACAVPARRFLITAESARGEDHPSYIISVAQHEGTLRMLAARCQELVKDARMRWAYIAISRTARCVDATQVEASSLADFPGGALVMSKHVNGVFSHVATTKTAYDKDIGHCLSRTGLVHAKAGLVDSMRKARGGEAKSSTEPSVPAHNVAAAAVGNADSS